MKAIYRMESKPLPRSMWTLRSRNAKGGSAVEIVVSKTAPSRFARWSTVSIPTDDPIVAELQRFAENHSLPECIYCDDLLKFQTSALKHWLALNCVTIIRTRRPNS